MTARRSFDQVTLGEPLPPMDVGALADGELAVGLVERFVAAWAGRGAVLDRARIIRCLPSPRAEALQLAGRVYGRHMDGSRRIEVEVVGHDGLGDRLRGMVRVKLA